MKNQYVTKGLAVGIICLLMLVSIPIISGETIRYPREEGPYNVLIFGKCTGMGGGTYTFWLHFSPLWFLFYPLSVDWHFEEGSSFYVNGELQEIVYPAQIDLCGFKGYGQSTYMSWLKWSISVFIFFLTGFQPTTRARVIGRWAEILVDHNYNATL